MTRRRKPPLTTTVKQPSLNSNIRADLRHPRFFTVLCPISHSLRRAKEQTLCNSSPTYGLEPQPSGSGFLGVGIAAVVLLPYGRGSSEVWNWKCRESWLLSTRRI